MPVRRRPRPSLHAILTRPALIAGLVALELLLAYAVVEDVVPVTAIAAVALLAVAITFMITAPRTFLLVLAAVWGITHSLMKDYPLLNVGSIEVTLSRGLGLVVVLGLMAVLVMPRHKAPPLPVALKALLGLVLLFGLLAVPLAPDKAEAASDFVRILSGVLIGIVAYREFGTRSDFLKLARVVTIAGVAVAVITILQLVLLRAAPGIAATIFGAGFYEESFDPNSVTSSAVRVSGPIGGAQETAGFLVVALAFALVRWWTLRERGRSGLTAAACVVIASGIVVTLTRAAMLALLVLLLLWALQRQSSVVSGTRLRVRLLALVVAFVAIAIPLIGVQTLASRLSDANPTASGQNFAQGRALIWNEEIKLLQASGPARLLVGHGGHSSYLLIYTSQGPPTRLSPHNVFLWSMVELGVLGLIAYVAFLVTLLGTYARTARRWRFTMAGKVGAVGFAITLAYLAQDMFTLSVSSPGHRWYFMLFVGASLRLCYEAARRAGDTVRDA